MTLTNSEKISHFQFTYRQTYRPNRNKGAKMFALQTQMLGDYANLKVQLFWVSNFYGVGFKDTDGFKLKTV